MSPIEATQFGSPWIRRLATSKPADARRSCFRLKRIIVALVRQCSVPSPATPKAIHLKLRSQTAWQSRAWRWPDQIKNLDWRTRKAARICKVPEENVVQV